MDQWFSTVPTSQMAPVVKNLPAKAGDVSSIPGLGRSTGVRNVDPLQYSCLGNPTDRGAWQITVHGTTKSWMQLNTHTHTHTLHVDLQWRYSLNLVSLFSSHSYLYKRGYHKSTWLSSSVGLLYLWLCAVFNHISRIPEHSRNASKNLEKSIQKDCLQLCFPSPCAMD